MLAGDGDELGGTLADLVDRYIEEVLPLRKQARSELPRLQRIKQAFWPVSFALLTPADCSRWLDVRLRKGASAGTCRHDLNTFSKLLGHAIGEWGLEGVRKIVRDDRKPALASGRNRRLNESEIRRLLAAALPETEASEHVRAARSLHALIVLALETSMRLGVKPILRKYEYPPDQQEAAVELVLQQARALGEAWS